MNRESYIIESLKSDYIGDDGATIGDTIILAWMGSIEGVHFKEESGIEVLFTDWPGKGA